MERVGIVIELMHLIYLFQILELEFYLSVDVHISSVLLHCLDLMVINMNALFIFYAGFLYYSHCNCVKSVGSVSFCDGNVYRVPPRLMQFCNIFITIKLLYAFKVMADAFEAMWVWLLLTYLNT